MAVPLLEFTYLGQPDEVQEIREARQLGQNVDRRTVRAYALQHRTYRLGRDQQGRDWEYHDRVAKLSQKGVLDGGCLAALGVVEEEWHRGEGGGDRPDLLH